ncbi:MAG: hypothetical protein V2A77_03750 [Pseudomonadota bacterium]
MDAERTLVLRVEGELGQPGKVPLALLADKLQAAQRVLNNIGSALRGGGRRGAWKAEVLQACELIFQSAHHSSLEVVATVPEPTQISLPDLDTGKKSLAHLGRTVQALQEHDRQRIADLYPDYGQRARVLSSLLSLFPEEGSEYDLAIKTASAETTLTGELRSYVARMAREELVELPGEALRTLTGKLYRIEVETGQRHLGLIVQNRHILCYYSAEYEDIVRDLVPGSLVEVEGKATLDEEGRVQRIEDIIDARSVQLVPLYWTRIVWADKIFVLRRPMQIRNDFQDGLWIHEYEPLAIYSYGATRAESLDAFRAEFAACWDLIAQEEDKLLTEDARELKQTMKAIVEEVKPLS